jgi:hypothetical protein
MVYTDLHYFGCLSYYTQLVKSDIVLFDLTAPFSKMSFKNRMIIAAAQGPLNLTIPIVGGRDQKTPMNEIKITNDSTWQKQHFKSIYSSYKRSPYFDYYEESLSILYNTPYLLLNDFLFATQVWVKTQLKAKYTFEPLFISNETSTQIKWIDPYKPNNFKTQVNPIIYQQVFETTTGFIPNCSILDLLFAVGGKQALSQLK